MSRCKACDVILDGVELSKKDSEGNYYDLCALCYSYFVAANWDIDTSGNNALTQEDYLQLQDTYDKIIYSISNDDY